ncbi:MAG TPA: outer membrane protein assembly factor BamE [Acetobacteraceae bacterium]|nr:outer membrane protein assembly factor BamE [Acetobacteraceae bacterium]
MRPFLPFLLLLAALLPACSVVETPRTLRGNKVDADQLKELVPGTSTRADVTSLLGSPSARATFDDNQWIYISETTHTRVGRTPGVLEQNVTVLTFDDRGVLRDVKRLNEDDSRPVSVVSRATPSPGSEASFLQQLLGNVGKFNAGGFGGSTGGNTDTAPGGGIGSSRGSSTTGPQ